MTKLVRLAAIYSIFIGMSMIVVWAMLYLTNQIPELKTTPVAISMHITAEIITAFLLVFGGIGLLLKRVWGFQTYMFSMGFLVYTLIQSPGYYVEKGEFVFIAIFGCFMFIALFFILMTFLKRDEFFRG